jgi:hypothetical protein
MRQQSLMCETYTMNSEILLDHLDCTFGALDFACSTHETFFRFDSDGLLLLDLEDTYRACISTRAASSALSIIYNYFHHLQFPLRPEFQ